MRVQGAQLPDVNLRGLPTVSAGPTASAEHFGAGGINRQLGQFGRAVQGFGEEVIRQDQIRRQKEDEVFSRNAVNEAHRRLADQKKAVYDQYKGQASYQAPEKMGELTKRIRDEVSKGLLNQHQKDAFDSAMNAMENQSQVEAIGYRDRQMEVARVAGLDSQNELIMETAESNVAAANTPDGMAANRGRLEQIFDNVNSRYAGMPEETKSLERRKAAQTFHRGILGAMEPAEAIKYLDQEGVVQAFGVAETRRIKAVARGIIDKRENDARDAEAEMYAIAEMDGGKSLMALQPELIEKYGSDRGRLAYQAAVTRDNLRKNQQAEAMKAKVEGQWDEYYKTGKIPGGVARKEREAMLKDQSRQARGEKGGDPWAFGQYLMDNFAPEELKQMQRDGKWSEVYPKLLLNGKAVGITKDVSDYIAGNVMKGTISPEKFARTQFIAITGIRPGTGEGVQDFNRFMGLFTEEAEKRAGDLELDNVNKLPREEQEKIIANLLELGDYGYSWQPNFLSPDKYRFQVMGKASYEDYFHPKAEQPAQRIRNTAMVAPHIGFSPPMETKQSSAAGPRDTVIGGEITTNQGVKQRVEGGKIIVNHPLPEERDDGVSPEPSEFPAKARDEMRWLLELSGATKTWNGEEWIIAVPNVGLMIFDSEGNRR